MIDKNEDTTANFNLFRYKIIPRLDGWFGKTLKQIHQTEQIANIDLPFYSPGYNWIESIHYKSGYGPSYHNPMFAEIDAMTTSLLARNGNDSTFGKSLNKRLLVKGPIDMQSRLNDLIKSRFGIEENRENKVIPTKYFLYNNYPNPFNPTTTIRFDLPERTNIELSVYNILGQKVKTLINNETRNAGRYEVSFNGNSLASGVYVYRFITKNYTQSRKMLLIK